MRAKYFLFNFLIIDNRLYRVQRRFKGFPLGTKGNSH